MIKKIFIFTAGLLCFITLSCKSIKQPSSIVEAIDYTNEDIVQNEIRYIRDLQKDNCVKALYRAVFLGREEIKNECIETVKTKVIEAVKDKQFVQADRYLKSLSNIGINYEPEQEINLEWNVPGLSNVDKSKLPATIQNCIDATVTVWVDRGLKVENGAGLWDIVIGSGFFIDKRGYLVTNHHVIQAMVDPKDEKYSRLYIKLPSDMETKIPAKVVGYDPVIDLALLKVEYEPEFIFELGSSSDLSVGAKISAIGTPLGLEGTLTSGIISSVSRKLFTKGNVFQIDAAVNSGNSGGPIIDEDMKVQAIVFAGIQTYQGLNFAIPVEYLKQELPLLYSGQSISHTWISAYGHTKKLRNQQLGVEIQYVMPGGSAAFAGLKEGDLLTKVDNIDIKSLEDFQMVLMKYPAGIIVPCTYVRDEEEKDSILLLEKRGDKPLLKIFNSDFIQDSFVPIFGIKMVPSSTTNKKSYRITKVINGSVADENGFSENDTIEVHDVIFDNENNRIIAQIYISRRKKGYLKVPMLISAPYDSPYYL